MLILAVEQSAAIGSCAICNDSDTLAESQWDAAGTRGQPLFTHLDATLADAGVPAADIDMFAVGLGPGRFSSLRVALTALKALALPGHRPVYGISSGEILARDIFDEHDTPRVLVAGDARRERIWYAVFGKSDGDIIQEVPYTMIPNDDFPPCLPRDALVATSEWDRLETTFDELGIPTAALIAESRYPRALTAAAQIRALAEKSRAQEAVSPIYMHPPVFVEPKFPAG